MKISLEPPWRAATELSCKRMWSRDRGPAGTDHLWRMGILSIFMKLHLFASSYCFVHAWLGGGYVTLHLLCSLNSRRWSSGGAGQPVCYLPAWSDKRYTTSTVAARLCRPTWPPRQELRCLHTAAPPEQNCSVLFMWPIEACWASLRVMGYDDSPVSYYSSSFKQTLVSFAAARFPSLG